MRRDEADQDRLRALVEGAWPTGAEDERPNQNGRPMLKSQPLGLWRIVFALPRGLAPEEFDRRLLSAKRSPSPSQSPTAAPQEREPRASGIQVILAFTFLHRGAGDGRFGVTGWVVAGGHGAESSIGGASAAHESLDDAGLVY